MTIIDDQAGPTRCLHCGGRAFQSVDIVTPRITPSRSDPRKPVQSFGPMVGTLLAKAVAVISLCDSLTLAFSARKRSSELGLHRQRRSAFKSALAPSNRMSAKHAQ